MGSVICSAAQSTCGGLSQAIPGARDDRDVGGKEGCKTERVGKARDTGIVGR